MIDYETVFYRTPDYSVRELMTFAQISCRPEFEKDLKKLLKRFRSFEGDLATFESTQLNLSHKQKLDNRGVFLIDSLGIEHPKIFKARKFACKSLLGTGASSGIRIIYAYLKKATISSISKFTSKLIAKKKTVIEFSKNRYYKLMHH